MGRARTGMEEITEIWPILLPSPSKLQSTQLLRQAGTLPSTKLSAPYCLLI